ncbi:hypothetical protein TRL7639_00483 [Falsiruegeria litorea R37]|uniref:Uncharacterized protein n=1 Tax=Falsiruegeria litorea R37 TaxID=1200284 RepID=A0A1Y5RL69_9RHOB|nr:hypothetical protein TRL7639_00483 [Falsiruegeria litorea R37]
MIQVTCHMTWALSKPLSKWEPAWPIITCLDIRLYR